MNEINKYLFGLNDAIQNLEKEVNKLISYDRSQDGELARLAGIVNTYDEIPEKEIRFLIDLLRGMPEASVVVAKEKEHFYDVFKRMFGISDLEKKIDELYAEWTGLENDNDQLEQRIEKLEASSASHTEVLREFNEALLGKNIIGISFYKDIKAKLYGKGGDKLGGDSKEMTHTEAAKYELEHPDEFDTKGGEKTAICQYKEVDFCNYFRESLVVGNLRCEPCKVPKEKPPEPTRSSFVCGNCSKLFETYHDGEGLQTGYCSDCFLLYEAEGLPTKEKPPEQAGEDKE